MSFEHHPPAAAPEQTAATEPRAGRARRRAGLALVLGAVLSVAAACSSGPGTEAEFVELLTRDGSLNQEEATCISEAVFAEYGADEEVLGKISAAPDYAYLSSEEGVPGFTEFFEQTVQGCAQVGPVAG